MNEPTDVTRRSQPVCTAVHTDAERGCTHVNPEQATPAARRSPPLRFRSLGLGTLRLGSLGLVLTVASTGCIIVRDGDDDGWVEPAPGPPPGEIFTVGIDEGAQLEADAGSGVGIYVEYQGAGGFRVWTTCDTELSGYACSFDIFAIGAGMGRGFGEDLEGNDELVANGEELYAYLETDYDTDGFRFRMADGAPMRLEVYLDGNSEPRFVYWVSGGVLQRGAPSNPVDFQP
jgi:hypothetical protein